MFKLKTNKMKDGFIISTTENIENGIIKQYIDVICSNIVVGTNIFSDLAASFSDFFGGKSGSYRRKLEYIYSEASKDLKNKAIRIGANAIIGFKVDFDEISGKDKSMFMVSVSGTACKIEYNSEYDSNAKTDTISQSDLDRELKKRFIQKKLQNKEQIKEDWVQFLIENPQKEIIKDLVDLYVRNKSDMNTKVAEMIENVLSTYPKPIMVPFLYELYIKADRKDILISLIEKCNLFDAASILKICSQDIHEGVKLLHLRSDYYDRNELSLMNKICDVFDNLPDTGKIEKVKSGVFNKKEEDKFICEHGHKNPVEQRFCESCSVDIKGIHINEASLIDKFKEKVEILSELLK